MANQFEIPGLDASIKNLKNLSDQTETFLKVLLQVAINGDKAMAPFKDAATIKTFNDAQKTSATATDAVTKANERLTAAQSAEAKELAVINIQIQQANSLNKENAKLNDSSSSSLQKLNAQISQSTRASKELGAQMILLEQEGKKNSQEYANVARQFQEASAKSKTLNDSYRDISKSAGDNRALVGSYSDELKGHFETISGGLKGFKDSIIQGDISGIISNGKQVITGFGDAMKKSTEISKAKAEQSKLTGTAAEAEAAATESAAAAEATMAASTEISTVSLGMNTSAMAGNTVTTETNTVATNGMTVAQKAYALATDLVSTALKLFRLALISTGIGAVIVALGSLIAYFASTQEGIDKVTAVTRPLQAIFQSLIGVAQDLGKMISDAFSNPQKTAAALVDFIKGQVMNRLEGMYGILKDIATLNFSNLGNDIGKATTGIDNLTSKISNAAGKTADFFSKAAAKGSELDKIQKSIEASEAKIVLIRAQDEDKIKELELIAKDRNKSAKERNAAALEAISISKRAANDEKEINNQKIKAEIIKQGLSDSGRADEKTLNELRAKNIEEDSKQKSTELRFLKAKGALQKEDAQNARKDAADAKNERKEAAAEAKKAEQDKRSFTINSLKATLDYTIATHKQEQFSATENIAFLEVISKQKIAIAAAELNKEMLGLDKNSAAAKILKTKNATELLKIELEKQNAIQDLENKNSEFQLELYDFRNKTLIESGADLTDILVNAEKKRLEDFQKMHLDALAKELKIDDDKLKAKIANNEKISANELKYLKEKEKLEKQTNDAVKKNDLDLIKVKEKSIDEETKREQAKYKGFSKFGKLYDALTLKSDKKNLQEKLKIQTKGSKDEIESTKQLADNKILIDQTVSDAKKQTLSDGLDFFIEIAGKDSEIGKAAAIAKITMDTIDGASKAFTIAHALAADPVTAPLAINAFIQGGLIIAEGAVKAGQVAGIKLFAEGTDNAPYTGKAIVDEIGAEFHFDKNWNLKSQGSEGGARLTDIVKGDKIIPADVSALLRYSMYSGKSVSGANTIDYQEIGKQFGTHAGKIVSAINKNGRNQMSVTVQKNITDRVTFKGKRV